MAKDKNKYYTILAGRKEPAKVLQGTLNKETGMPSGTPQKVSIVVGAILIPNHTLAWGRRVTDKSKKDSRSVSLNDPEYRGKIEFLKYGDPLGESIQIRYLPGSSTLDRQYQDTIQKLKPTQEDAVIILQQGLNNFNIDKEPMKSEMLMHHGLNRDSICRDETKFEYDFVEFDSAKRNLNRITQINVQNAANAYVVEADKDTDKTKILAHIFNIDTMLDDGVIIEQLLDKAKDFPVEFVDTINKHKLKVEVLLDDAESLGVIEFKDDRLMMTEDERSKKVLEGIQGEGKDKKLWLIQRLLDDVKVFDTMVALEKVFKKAQLQTV